MFPSGFKNTFNEFDYVLICLTCQQICYGIYDGIERDIPGGVWFISPILLFWLVANWVLKDVKITGVTWVAESRFTLFIAWPIFVPIYLFQTRKMKAFKEISCYFAFWIFFRIFGVIAGKLLSV